MTKMRWFRLVCTSVVASGPFADTTRMPLSTSSSSDSRYVPSPTTISAAGRPISIAVRTAWTASAIDLAAASSLAYGNAAVPDVET